MKKFNVGQVMGWKGESTRHSLARRGVKTGHKSDTLYNVSGKSLHSRGSSSDMREFRFNDHISILAHSESTRSGFRHIAVLMIDGREVDSAKVTYLNRTWESYEYQTVMQKLIEKTSELSKEQKTALMDYTRKDHTDWSGFEMTAKIAKLGEVFGSTEKEKNDWKARMLKAGLGNQGLEMPEDWDTLSEEEKKKRLDGVIGVLNEHKKKPLTAKGWRKLPQTLPDATYWQNQSGKVIYLGKLLNNDSEYVKGYRYVVNKKGRGGDTYYKNKYDALSHVRKLQVKQ